MVCCKEDFETRFRLVFLSRVKFHEEVGQLYGVPHGILRVFNTIFLRK
jgi:hypothetical protein